MMFHYKSLKIWHMIVVYLLSPVMGGERPSGDMAVMVEGNNRFALDLYSVLKKEPNNLFFSPYSISAALAMAYGGARGNTADEIHATLHFDLGPPKTHPAFAEFNGYLEEIQKTGQVQLHIANSLWPAQNLSLQAAYLALMKDHYRVSITPLDYASDPEACRLTINHWVEDKTSKKIKELIRPLDITSLTSMVLVNAIYFKGNWACQFDPNLTVQADFILPNGTKKPVPMMMREDEVKYKQLKNMQVLELPYQGQQLSMVLLLPRNSDGLAALEAELSGPNLKGWLSDMSSQKVEVHVPRFKMTWGTFDLVKTLQSLGIHDAFIPGVADFTGIFSCPQKVDNISHVLHKAFVEVNEVGTEATAATAVIFARKCVAEIPIFRADHPFIFIIRDNATGSILFIGRVVDPAN